MAAKPRAVVVVAVLAVAIAVVASVSLYNYLKTKEAEVKEAKERAIATQKVVVADTEIPIGSTLDARELKLTDWPKANVPLGAVATMEEAEGRIALQTLMPGDLITQSKLRPTGGPAGIMTYKIPEGHRAITVAVDQVSGVAGFITPGSMVDVVVTTKPPGKRDPISRIVFQNVPVLATGQIVEQREGEPVLVPTVTLDLSPEDSERMTLASTEGKLRLLLRRAGDMEMTATSGATVAKVLSVPGKPRIKRVARRTTRTAAKRPAKPAPRGPSFETLSVEIWRSTAKTVETFKVEKEAK